MNQAELDNRFTYHPPTADQATHYVSIRATAKQLAEVINTVCSAESREKSSAMTKLDEVVFWANAAIARNPGTTATVAKANGAIQSSLTAPTNPAFSRTNST